MEIQFQLFLNTSQLQLDHKVVKPGTVEQLQEFSIPLSPSNCFKFLEIFI
jgi:hypothetical protein